MAATEGNGIIAFTGVYDADGTLAGELAYWVGAHVTGSRHCALCGITHGTFREKARWRELAGALPVPFEAVHLDERSPAVAAASEGTGACVVAERADGSLEVVLGPGELDAMAGDPDRLAEALRSLA
jgi:hypothetical protein